MPKANLKKPDNIYLEELNFYAEDLEAKYETEKKEAQIKLQQASIKQKNTLNYILISSAGGLLIISLLSYRNYRNRQKLQQQRISELETEKQLLATQSLLKGQEDERSRLAKDLHDGLGGLLSGVKLQLGAMKGNLILSEEHGHAFNNALNKLDDSISEMRRVAHNMMPEALINLGLEQALNDYCDGLSASQPFTINCEFYGLEQRMEPSIEIVVYRIVQELLNNAVKHANATIILAQVIRRENNLAITIEDNGKGFDTAQLDKMRTAGLRNIYSRVNYLHGQIDIQSVPDKGTSVHIDCLIESNE
jgi:two-component system NarL family sensor kinase